MAIRHWHPLKLIIVWVVDLAILWTLLEMARRGDRHEAIFFWLILSIPVFIITWKWASKHELNKSGQHDSETESQSRTSSASRKEYRICKLQIQKSLLDDGFVIPSSESQEAYWGSVKWTEKREKTYRSIQEFEREIEGWKMLSLFPLGKENGEEDKEELTVLALMERSMRTENGFKDVD